MTVGDAYTIGLRAGAGAATVPEAGGPDFDFGSSPILVDLRMASGRSSPGKIGGRPRHRSGPRGRHPLANPGRHGGKLGGMQWGSAADSEHVYVAVSDVVVRMVAAGEPGAEKALYGGQSFRLDPTAGGGLFALSLETGQVVWHTPHPGCGDTPGCSPAQSAAVTAIPGIVFSGGLDGHLRAYAAATTGAIIWDFDTQEPYTTVNGVSAHGGSLDGPGAVVVGGMLYVNSGYAFTGGAPGNVLLAFSVGGK